MEFIEYLQNGLLSRARELMADFGTLPTAASLSMMESAVQGLTSVLGQTVLGDWLTKQEGKYPAERVACECGEQAHYERRREAVTITLLGRVSYERAYYRCGCGRGC